MLSFIDYYNIARHRGIKNMLHELHDLVFIDLRYDIETDIRNLNSLSEEQYHGYVGIFSRIVFDALKYLDGRLVNPEKYIFVDIGCGKGKPLIVSKKFNFKKSIGIELNEELYRKAVININRCGFANSINLLHKDITKIDFEADGFLEDKAIDGYVYFAYDPIEPSLLISSLNSWFASTSGLKHFFIYCGHDADKYPYKKLYSRDIGKDKTRETTVLRII